MLGDAIRNLKFDRRLSRRRGWFESGEFEKALEALPDVAAKATTAEQTESGAAPPASGEETLPGA